MFKERPSQLPPLEIDNSELLIICGILPEIVLTSQLNDQTTGHQRCDPGNHGKIPYLTTSHDMTPRQKCISKIYGKNLIANNTLIRLAKQNVYFNVYVYFSYPLYPIE